MPLSTEYITKLVHEANVSFILNMRLFEELDVLASVPGATVRPLQYALNFGMGITQNSDKKNSSQCPFAGLAKGAENTQDVSSSKNSHYSKTNFSLMKGKDPPPECPFAKLSKIAETKEDSNTGKPMKSSGRCPWPFVFAHDPIQGVRDWQTWVVFGFLLSYYWFKLNH